MGSLSREAILGASDTETEQVEVPEWGGAVRVRGMTGTERDAWEDETFQSKTKGGVNRVNIRARLVVRVVLDDKGERIFTDDDAPVLGGKSGKALDRVFDVAMRLSGLADTDKLAKNSASDPDGEATSDSPNASA